MPDGATQLPLAPAPCLTLKFEIHISTLQLAHSARAIFTYTYRARTHTPEDSEME